MTKEEKEVLYQCYLESGPSPKDFAKANNISSVVIRELISFHKRIDSHEQLGLPIFQKAKNTRRGRSKIKTDFQ